MLFHIHWLWAMLIITCYISAVMQILQTLHTMHIIVHKDCMLKSLHYNRVLTLYACIYIDRLVKWKGTICISVSWMFFASTVTIVLHIIVTFVMICKRNIFISCSQRLVLPESCMFPCPSPTVLSLDMSTTNKLGHVPLKFIVRETFTCPDHKSLWSAAA